MIQDRIKIVVAVLGAQRSTGIVPLIIGKPGNAKSSFVNQLAIANGSNAHVLSVSRLMPEDLNGMPCLSTDRSSYSYANPAWATQLNADDFLFLDEVNQGPPRVEAAIMRLALEGELGTLTVPSYRIAAMNPIECSTGARPFGAPTANRFAHITGWTADLSVFWAFAKGGNGFHPPKIPTVTKAEMRAQLCATVLPFLEAVRPANARGEVSSYIEVLPENPEEHSGPWPSQRTWTATAAVHAALAKMNCLHLLEEATATLVGKDAAAAYSTFVIEKGLPTVAEIVADPSVIYGLDDATAITLAQKVVIENHQDVVVLSLFLGRLCGDNQGTIVSALSRMVSRSDKVSDNIKTLLSQMAANL